MHLELSFVYGEDSDRERLMSIYRELGRGEVGASLHGRLIRQY